jgi:hypothetical protein
MNNLEKRKLSFYAGKYLLFPVIVLSIYLYWVVRPVQDDYVVLRDMAQGSALESTKSLWFGWGGNITASFFVNAISGISLDRNLFLGLALHSLVTLVLLCLSIFILSKWAGIADLSSSPIRTQLLLLLVLFSMGGLVNPTYISIFNFSWAATAHLWPIMLSIVSISSASYFRSRYWPLFIIFGFLAGNCNVTESAFLVLSVFGLLILKRFGNEVVTKFNSKNLFALFAGSFVGLSVIVFSPGFRERASIVGGPANLSETAARFIRSFLIDFGDFLLHPGWLLGLFLGIVSRSQLLKNQRIEMLRLKRNVLAIGTFLLFLLIVIGDTVAYPSWYHTTPIYIFVLPLFFLIGVCSGVPKLSSRMGTNLHFLTALIATLSIILTARDLIVLGIRKEQWDKDFKVNVCQIQKDELFNLSGRSFTYPPLNLGVEDVEDWLWIKTAYSQWVKARQIDCPN